MVLTTSNKTCPMDKQSIENILKTCLNLGNCGTLLCGAVFRSPPPSPPYDLKLRNLEQTLNLSCPVVDVPEFITLFPAMDSPPPPGEGSIMTCTACRVRVYGVTARNNHYRSDLHRVNLKRKVAGLGPLLEDEFQQRLEAIRNETVEQKRSRESQFCEVCSKKFSSVRALENHNNSKRHRDALRIRPMSEVSEDQQSDQPDVINEDVQAMEEADIKRRLEEAVAIPPTVCVFDGHESATLKDNVAYMASKFGFFVPYIESLIDLEGLLTYIGQKVGVGYCCVECDRPFASISAVRRHMIDKEHCCMTSDDEFWVEEFGEFYDFGTDGSNEAGAEDVWEEVPESEMSNFGEENLSTTAVIANFAPLSARPPQHNADEVSLAVNGKLLGHRSLHRYYKQSYPNSERRDAVLINKVLGEYRLLGWRGNRTLPVEVRAARMQSMRKRKFDLQVGRSNYYTRKSAIKPSMAVFNSGYRP